MDATRVTSRILSLLSGKTALAWLPAVVETVIVSLLDALMDDDERVVPALFSSSSGSPRLGTWLTEVAGFSDATVLMVRSGHPAN